MSQAEVPLERIHVFYRKWVRSLLLWSKYDRVDFLSLIYMSQGVSNTLSVADPGFPVGGIDRVGGVPTPEAVTF